MVAADLNGNNQTDLVIVDAGVGQIVLLGDLVGSDFATRSAINISGPVDVLVDNFDSDADLELAVLSKAFTSRLTIYQPVAPFTYTADSQRSTGRTNPGRMVAGDFNNDTVLDVAVFHAAAAGSPNDSREVAVLAGTGTGAFADPIVSTIGSRNFESAIVAGFFVLDDSIADLALISGSDIVLLAGDGAGRFIELASIDDSEDQGKPSRLAAWDVDADGDTDLAFTSIREQSFGGKTTDAAVFENVGGSFVRRFRAFQINVVFTTQRVVPVLLAGYETGPGSADAMRLAIAAPSQDVSSDFSFGIKHSSRIAKQHVFFLSSTDVTGRNFGIRQAVPVTLAIIPDDATRNEGDTGLTPFTFTVTRSGNTSDETTVDFTVSGSGANPVDAVDFGGTFPSGQITFVPGQQQATITVFVAGDLDVEQDESFSVTLVDDSGSLNLVDPVAQGTVLNDDAFTSAVEIVSAVYGVEATGGNSVFSFPVMRTGDLTDPATITYAVTGRGPDTASGGDFGGQFPSGDITFQPGQTEQSIEIVVRGDSIAESDETFAVTLTGASAGVAIQIDVGVGRIFDDDHPGDLYVVNPALIVPAGIVGVGQAEMALLNVDADTTLTMGRLGIVGPADPVVRVFDRDLNEIQTSGDDSIQIVSLTAGEQYALVFNLIDKDRTFFLRSSAAEGSLNGSVETNFVLRVDVNADGDVSALDALQVINELPRRQNGASSFPPEELVARRYYDVSGTDGVSARDALLVINELARRQVDSAGGELIATPLAFPFRRDPGGPANRWEIIRATDALFSDDEMLGELF